MSDLAQHSSKTVEHYTPSDIVEAARATMGGIDLDPASCEVANHTVRADHYFTKVDNGLIRPWAGNVFLNPPGGKIKGKSQQKAWWFKLAEEWLSNRVASAIFVGFSIEILQNSQIIPAGAVNVRPLDFPICIPSRRVAYVREDGEIGDSPPHASVIVCLPHTQEVADRFKKHFSKIDMVIGLDYMDPKRR